MGICFLACVFETSQGVHSMGNIGAVCPRYKLKNVKGNTNLT